MIKSHPAAWHNLDVAAVLKVLLTVPEFGAVIPTEWHAALIYLTALHDIGKFTRSFQALAQEHWPTMLGPYQNVPAPRHDTLGWQILTGPLRRELAAVFPEWSESKVRIVIRAVTGHHGRPPEEPETGLLPVVFCTLCQQAATMFMRDVQDHLAPAPCAAPNAKTLRHASWLIAGLVNLADWIGSAEAHFPYVAAARYDLAGYWEVAQARATRAVAESGLLGSPVSSAQGMRALFPKIERPTWMQRWAETVVLPAGPALALIEDGTGSGKTEAAVVLAHRLMAAGRAGGLYFALPTMATANAMFDRLGQAYLAMFGSGSTPSLVLAHGRRGDHAGFRAAILDKASGAVEDETIGEDESRNAAGPSCAAWIADDRRKAFLAEIGTGTIDQALLAALPNKFAALRLLGLARRVLIVDEAHAYDPYMQAELRALLRFQAAMGGSAIVLSATLPQALRRELANAYADGLGVTEVGAALVQTRYPLATLVSAMSAREYPGDPSPRSVRRLRVRRIATADEAIATIVGAAEHGAAVAWIRNTVDDAIAAYETVRDRLRDCGIVVTLFHARFAMQDRLNRESAVMERFGSNAPEQDRRGVVIATQVIEQSLDLDFDVLISDLAPIDVLIQRAGRLWRDPDRKGRCITDPELLVLSPEPVDHPDEAWLGRTMAGTEAVYRDPALLWRTARLLFSVGIIDAPDGVRPLIETVYAKDAEIPPGLQAKAAKAYDAGLADGSLGEFNVLRPEDGYCRVKDKWADDIRVPTRLTDNTTLVRLARIEAGRVMPWAGADTPDRAWALSEVKVRSSLLGDSRLAPDLAALVDVAKAGWRKWQRDIPVLVLAPEPQEWWTVLNLIRAPRYHREVGLVL